MKKLFLLLFLATSSTLVNAQESSKKQESSLPYIQYVSEHLQSSGMPDSSQFRLIQKEGFTHVISLNQGDFSYEADSLKKMGISFTQIEVDSQNPTLEDFKTFIKDMKIHNGEKILVHCKTNRKASAFVYAYRVSELNADQDEAFGLTYKLWEPHGGFPENWTMFFEEVLKKKD